MDLALNNLQWLICHKIQPTNQPMNVQLSVIWELMLYMFKLGYSAAETPKNIYWAKGEDAVVHRKVIIIIIIMLCC